MWKRVLLFFTITVSTTFGYNLESRIPIVKRGASGSYFGYSVAEHQEVPEDGVGKSKSWLLVGAPVDQNRQPGTNRSGALWQCPLTTFQNDCTQVITDGRLSFESDDLIPPGNDEIKDGQWLGVIVRSRGVGGKVMVCAHRHIVKTADSQWGQGQCYILTQDLKFQDIKKPCSGKPTNKAHEQFGYCQAGTSGVLTSEDRVVIGTPGPHTWRGTLFLLTVSDEFLTRDNTVYNAPMQDSSSPVNKYSYLGMSVAVGNFFGSELSYAAGAPRSNGAGQVVLLTRRNLKSDMDVVLTLDGEQFASSYGYEIASADVNGDKFTDLIVAAPFYFNKEEGGAVYVYTALNKEFRDNIKYKPTKLVGREESRFGFALANLGDLNKDGYEDIAVGAPYEGKGAIYIYLGSKNGIITVPSQVIHAEDTPIPLKTFGYSLSGGVDMDQNGYPDLLAGAYEDDAVILLRSRKIIDINTYIKYMKKDGMYQEKIEPIDPNKLGCLDDPTSNHTCFSFEACCETASLTMEEEMQNLKLNYFIEAETFSGTKKFSRIWFGSSHTRSNYVNRTVTLDSTKIVHCQKEIVYLKENTRDIQSPIKFRLNYSLIQEEPILSDEGAPLPDIKKYPILNQQTAARVFEATFQKDCGNNDICESDLRINCRLNLAASPVKPNFYELLLGEKEEVIIDVNASNIGESAYEAQLFIIHSESLDYIASKSNDSVSCNLHNTTLVVCSIGNPFKKDKSINVQVRFDPKSVEDNESQLDFVIFANSTSKEVHPKDPIKLQATVVKRAELSIKGNAKTQWAFYGGPVVGESAIKHLNEIGPKVSHIYEVFNEGPWKMSYLEVRISWPYEVANDKHHGKWLLYLEEVPAIQGTADGECILPQGHTANPLKLPGSLSYDDLDPLFASTTTSVPISQNHTSYSRIKRDTEKVVNTRTIIDKDGHRHQVVSMNCKAGTAKCFDITCFIYNLPRKQEATITVKARLWNSTLVEDYPRVDQVKIGSSARIIIPPNIVIQQENLKDDYATAETIAYPDLLDQHEGEPVPLWIIVVSVVAGLLLLILLTLILRKLGFFKRRRPDPTLSGNLEKHRDDNPESEALFKH